MVLRLLFITLKLVKLLTMKLKTIKAWGLLLAGKELLFPLYRTKKEAQAKALAIKEVVRVEIKILPTKSLK